MILKVHDNNWIWLWFPLHISPDDNNADNICPLLQVAVASTLSQCPVHTERHTVHSGHPTPARAQPRQELQVLAPSLSLLLPGLVPAKPGQRQEIVRQEWGQAQLSSSSYLPGTASQWRGPPDPSLATERALLGSAGHRTVRMAVLTDGQKYGLSSQSQTNKSVICVKLTDSALRSLEEYLKNKVSYI